MPARACYASLFVFVGEAKQSIHIVEHSICTSVFATIIKKTFAYSKGKFYVCNKSIEQNIMWRA